MQRQKSAVIYTLRGSRSYVGKKVLQKAAPIYALPGRRPRGFCRLRVHRLSSMASGFTGVSSPASSDDRRRQPAAGPSLYARRARGGGGQFQRPARDRKSTRLNSSHVAISYAVFCLKKKKNNTI